MKENVENFEYNLYDEVLTSLATPSWLKKGQLRDSLWHIKLSNGSEIVLDFDQPLTAWPREKSLLHPNFLSDLLTLKLLLIEALRPKPRGWCGAAASLRQWFKAHITFLRWRVEKGIASNSQLTFAWFNKFDATMKREAREGLLNLRARAAKILAAVDSRKVDIPGDGRGGHLSDKLARLMGLTSATEITGASRIAIEAYFAKNRGHYSRSAKDRTKPVTISTKITREAAKRFYRTWFDLWRFRETLAHDPISCAPFKSLRALSRWVRHWAESPDRTEDAPEYQACYLVNGCLKLLWSDVCEDALSLVAAGIEDVGWRRPRACMRDRAGLLKVNTKLRELGFEEIAPHYEPHKARDDPRLSVKGFIYGILLSICRIIKATFTARRDAEIHKTPIDCIEEDSAANNWLNCFIVKNLNRVDRIPVPKSVCRAVELVTKIRELCSSSGTRLYEFVCPIRKRPIDFKFGENLDKVAEYLGVPCLEDGHSWGFKPHQFRKFFGVTYFWRWAFPDLTALTYHFRHFNSDTTRGYIEVKAAEALRLRDEKKAKLLRQQDVQRVQDFTSAGKSFIRWIYQKSLNGDKVDGPLGRRIDQQIEELKQRFLPTMQITGEKTTGSFDEGLEKLIETTTIQFHPEGHSLCGASNTAADEKLAKCAELANQTGTQPRGLRRVPNFGCADDERCLECPLRGQIPSMSPYWDLEYKRAVGGLVHASAKQARSLKVRATRIKTHAVLTE